MNLNLNDESNAIDVFISADLVKILNAMIRVNVNKLTVCFKIQFEQNNNIM